MRSEKPYQLVLSRRAWAALRRLLLDRDAFGQGFIRWNLGGSRTCELLVDRIETTDRLPIGPEQDPFADWLIVVVAHDDQAFCARRWLRQIQPRKSQVAAVLVLSAEHRDQWDAAVTDQGQVSAVDGVRVVGPRMLNLTHSTASEPPKSVQDRFSRTIGALQEDVWRRLYDTHVTLVGSGRNGSQMAWQLAGVGVHHLTLIDEDVLEPPNLDSMLGLSAEDVGQSKVKALARRLIDFNPDMTIRCLTQPVNEALLDRLRHRSDLIVSCVDNDAARLAASWLSRETLTPHLDLGSSVQRASDGSAHMTGDVRLLLPHEGCVNCCGGVDDLESGLYALAAPHGSLHRGEPVIWSRQRAGSLATINALTVASAVQFWLDFLGGSVSGSYWHRLRWEPQAGLQVDSAAVSAAENCHFCSATQ